MATRSIVARILWPALGFPAVIAPRTGARNLADSDSTRTMCVLLLSNTQDLNSQDVARYLRCVPWGDRKQRTIKAGAPGSFSATQLTVRNRLAEDGAEDMHGKALTFGANQQRQNGITVSVSKYVRRFYAGQQIGLRYLHEVRVSEDAVARLPGDQFHLFWNKEVPDQTSFSNEMNVLLEHFMPKRLRSLGANEKDRSFLQNGYKFEYGVLHHPYNQADRGETFNDILHPVFIRQRLNEPLKIGHVTDTHVDIRNDCYARNLQRHPDKVRIATKGRPIEFDNWNESFTTVYTDAANTSDVVLMTGDLIDYGRGHLGNAIADDKLARDDHYYPDRNWFLFYYLLATNKNYHTPVYTTLGNHDWRLNPYPPFAPGAPAPQELIHNARVYTREERGNLLKGVVRVMHGEPSNQLFTYADITRDLVEIVKTAWKGLHYIPSLLFGSRANLDFTKLPTYTTEESVAWYLLVINPFLDYQFALPTGHEFLMLDFAEQEELKNSEGGKEQGPRALNCLTTLQKWFVERFIAGPGKAKTIGIHIPPLGPRPDWSVKELEAGVKTYRFPDTPRYKNANWEWRTLRDQPLPLMAVEPESFSPFLSAQYGSFVNKGTRKWFIEKLVGSQSVRLVFSGHIHRHGLLTAHWRTMSLAGDGPRTPPKIVKVLGVRSVSPQVIKGAKAPLATGGQVRIAGPLYVNTTSAGPRGNQYFDGGVDRSEQPGYSRVELSRDGTIGNVFDVPVYPRAATVVTAQAR